MKKILLLSALSLCLPLLPSASAADDDQPAAASAPPPASVRSAPRMQPPRNFQHAGPRPNGTRMSGLPRSNSYVPQQGLRQGPRRFNGGGGEGGFTARQPRVFTPRPTDVGAPPRVITPNIVPVDASTTTTTTVEPPMQSTANNPQSGRVWAGRRGGERWRNWGNNNGGSGNISPDWQNRGDNTGDRDWRNRDGEGSGSGEWRHRNRNRNWRDRHRDWHERNEGDPNFNEKHRRFHNRHNWDRNHHHRDWWRSRYNRFALFGGGYYYWNSGYWYPAYGYDPYFSTYSYDAPIYAYNDMDPGDIISNVQSELQQRGYYRGEVDGSFGPMTRRALLRFQSDNGLPASGQIDQSTLSALGFE